MPSPSTSLATLRPDLAESFMEFDLAADQAGYVGTKVFPVAEVASQAGTFGKIPLEELLQNSDTKRAPGSGYSRGDFTFETASYACQEHGHEEVVDDREAKMYAEYFDAEVISTARAFNAVLRNFEKRIADAVFNTTTWAISGTVASSPGTLGANLVNEWDDATNATPINDVEFAVQKIYDNSGLWPNALIINQKVFRNLRLCDQIRDRISSSGAGDSELAARVVLQQIADAFDLQHIIVAGGSQNTANEAQAASISQIWSGEYAMVCRIPTSNDFREPGIGRTFHWSADGSSLLGSVETYRDESVRGEVVRVRQDVDEIVLYPQAGYLLGNVTT